MLVALRFVVMCFWWLVLFAFTQLRAGYITEGTWPQYGWVFTAFFWAMALAGTFAFMGSARARSEKAEGSWMPDLLLFAGAYWLAKKLFDPDK
ncbi:MAG: hypothetical protein Kow0020_12470 [Wenzhouxiangellaceae bacterium]